MCGVLGDNTNNMKYYPIAPDLPNVLTKGKLGSEHYYWYRHNEGKILFTTLVTIAAVVALSEQFIMPFISA